jgi:hypothetical protein
VLASTFGPGVGDGNRREQGLGVGVSGPLVDVFALTDLDDLPEIHDRHPV